MYSDTQYWCIQTYSAFSATGYILYFLMWHTSCISWCGVQHTVSPGVTYIYSSSDIHSISWYGVYIVPQIYIVFPDMAYILYYLMWRTRCISWCGVQYASSSVVAYILFCRHRWHFLIKRTSCCISWCGVLFVFSDVAYNILYLLMWRICCSSDIHSIFCYDAHPIFPDITYLLYFLMWSTTHCISCCGVLFVFLDVTYNILYRLMRCKYCSSDIRNTSWYGVYPVFPDVTYFLYSLMCHTINSISWYGVHPIFTDVTY